MKTVIAVLVILAVCAGLLFGCGAAASSPRYTYRDAELYTPGPCELEESIRSLDIDWRAGEVNIAYHEEPYISVYEESGSTLSEKEVLRWRLDGDTLRIRFAGSGVRDTVEEKTLIVLLPAELSLRELSVDSVSADVYGENVIAENVSIETTSGNIRFSPAGAMRDFEAETVSGNVELLFPADASFILETESVSGKFDTDFVCERRKDAYVCGSGGMELDIETVWGDVFVLVRA